MERPSDHPPRARRQLIELISRALLDAELCSRLFEDTEAVARAAGLSDDEVQAVRRLDREKFEQRVVRIRSA